MKRIVSVPFTWPPNPWVSLPNSLAAECCQHLPSFRYCEIEAKMLEGKVWLDEDFMLQFDCCQVVGFQIVDVFNEGGLFVLGFVWRWFGLGGNCFWLLQSFCFCLRWGWGVLFLHPRSNAVIEDLCKLVLGMTVGLGEFEEGRCWLRIPESVDEIVGSTLEDILC